jgi:hypothetical protein
MIFYSVDEWITVGGPVPPEMLSAIGDVALAFAAVDVIVSMALCLKNSPSIVTVLDPKIFRCDLRKKLKRLGREYPGLNEKARAISDLSTERNDLMHGYVWESVWSATEQRTRYSVSNFGRGRSRDLSIKTLNELATNAMQFALEVENLISN